MNEIATVKDSTLPEESPATYITNKKHMRIAELLCQGLKPSAIAPLVGCSPALISQLVKDTDFSRGLELLAQQKDTELTAEAQEAEALNTQYEVLERSLLQKLDQASGMGMEVRDQIRLLETLIARKEKAESKIHALRVAREQGVLGHLGAGGAPIVSLMMPAHAAPEFAVNISIQTNAQNEITAIGNKALAPLSAPAVRDLFASRAVPAAPPTNTETVIEVSHHDAQQLSIPSDF